MLGMANEREHGEVIARMNNRINGGKRKKGNILRKAVYDSIMQMCHFMSVGKDCLPQSLVCEGQL